MIINSLTIGFYMVIAGCLTGWIGDSSEEVIRCI